MAGGAKAPLGTVPHLGEGYGGSQGCGGGMGGRNLLPDGAGSATVRSPARKRMTEFRTMTPIFQDVTLERLLDEVLALSHRRDRNEAIRSALEHEIIRLRQMKNTQDRVKLIQRRASALGLQPHGFDDKELMDELSGEL